MEADRAGAVGKLIEEAGAAFSDLRILLHEHSGIRARVKLRGRWQHYQIAVSEVLLQEGRLYFYYVLERGEVVVGFDNAPDNNMLRQIYGAKFSEHQHERIAHKHGFRKQACELTDEMTFEDFLGWLDSNLCGKQTAV